ncbi:hypothetical protein [Schlesneria sp. T3-172]|uniref:hypothetical protein n=1 Tax=Schlesneria sphaerica TaxID=3373610 RepID=UPI0037C67981
MMVVRSGNAIRQTTLETAWGWAVAAVVAWTATWFTVQCAGITSDAFADHAWYACAVLSLCPPMAVLGSRRPGTRVWMWFILFPMLMALAWPLLAVRLQGSELRQVQLELPQLLAFSFVLVMGVGNYVGTRFTFAALLYGAAVISSVISMSQVAPYWLLDRLQVRLWCSAAMAVSIGLSQLSRRPTHHSRFDQLWVEFFDLFGIVWGRRIQDRVNHIAQKESWPVRLGFEGFVLVEPVASSDMVLHERGTPTGGPLDQFRSRSIQVGADPALLEARIEQTFRWLLRRFVDPPWINSRLGAVATSLPAREEIDS